MRLLVGLIALLCFLVLGTAQEVKEKPTLALNVGGHTGTVEFVAFRNDDRELVSCALDRTIRVWDVATGESTKVLRLPAVKEAKGAEYIIKAALSPDEKQLAVSSVAPSDPDYWVYFIDLEKDKVTRVLKGHAGAITALAWSPDGRWLAIGGERGTMNVVLWDFANNAKKSLGGLAGAIRSLAFSPDSQTLAGMAPHKVKLWSVATGKGTVHDLDHPAGGGSVAWSPDGQTLAVHPAGEELYLWSAAGKLLEKINCKGDHLAFHPTKNTELLVGRSVVDLTSKKVRTFLKDQGDKDKDQGDKDDEVRIAGSGFAAAWSKHSLAAVGGIQALVLWSTKGVGVKEPERRLHGRGHVIHKVAWGGPSNASLAWSMSGKALPTKAFDFSTLRLGPADKSFQVEPQKRGEMSLERVGGRGGFTVNVKRGNEIVKAVPTGPFVRCLAFCGDSQIVVGGLANCRVYDIKTGERLGVYPFDHTWALAAEAQGRFFVAGGINQTLTIANPRTGSLLVSLFVAGNDWIAWAPEGYYAASPGGESLMGWQVTTDPEQLAVFYPAEHFRKSLCRPDVILLLLQVQEGTLKQALEKADQAAKKESTQLSPDAILPPKVAFLAPTAKVVKEAVIEVQAAAESTGENPVTALRLFVNDRPFEGLRGVKRFRTVGKKVETWSVSLAPGPNKLMVVGESSVSKSLPATMDVTYEPDQPLVPKKILPNLPNLYMLAIGIDKYVQGWQLQCCVNDATKLTETIGAVNKQPKLFGKVETKLVTNQAATRQGILDGFTWLKDNAKAHDVVILFYAGHGDTDDDGDFFLLSSAWAPNKKHKDTTVSGKELKERLADLPCRVLLLLDACKSGAAGKARQRVPPRIDKLSSELTGEVGAVVLFAAGSNELAGEDPKTGHGYFTSALIEGLSGKADLSPKDGITSLNELVTFVEYRVPELSDDNQHPTADKPGNVRSFPLAVCALGPAGKE